MSGSLTTYRPTITEVMAIMKSLNKIFDKNLGVSLYMVGSAWRKLDGIRPRGLQYDDYLNTNKVGDLDIVMAALKEADLEKAKSTIGTLFGICKNGNPRLRGIIGKTQVDIFPVKKKQLGAALVFFRSPQPLQLSLRILARARGYKLSPKGLYRIERTFSETREITDLVMHEAESTPFSIDVWNRLGILPIEWQGMEAAANYEIKEKLRYS